MTKYTSKKWNFYLNGQKLGEVSAATQAGAKDCGALMYETKVRIASKGDGETRRGASIHVSEV